MAKKRKGVSERTGIEPRITQGQFIIRRRLKDKLANAYIGLGYKPGIMNG